MQRKKIPIMKQCGLKEKTQEDLSSRLVNAFSKTPEFSMTSRFPDGPYKGFPLISVIMSNPEWVACELETKRIDMIPRAKEFLKRTLGSDKTIKEQKSTIRNPKNGEMENKYHGE